jgi:hypothetical protein
MIIRQARGTPLDASSLEAVSKPIPVEYSRKSVDSLNLRHNARMPAQPRSTKTLEDSHFAKNAPSVRICRRLILCMRRTPLDYL